MPTRPKAATPLVTEEAARPFELIAQFILNENGQPDWFEELDEDGETARIFRILLMVKPVADGKKLRRVTFYLDDDTFYQPVRAGEYDKKTRCFSGEITSYGDFSLTTQVHTEEDVFSETAWLSELLHRGYSEGMDQSMKSALRRIQKN